MADAQAGIVDTLYHTKAAPQAAKFNQGDQLWLGLETYLLDYAATYDRRLVVFTGPVLNTSDPVYRGVQIPLRFFKVAVCTTAGIDGEPELAATGYLMDQTPQVDDLGVSWPRPTMATPFLCWGLSAPSKYQSVTWTP